MRVLLLGPAAPTGGADPAAPVRHWLEVLAQAGVSVEHSAAINPDLADCDLAHLIVAAPIEHAVRQFVHARRWGRPVVVALDTLPAAAPGDPVARYAAALRRLVVDGAERVVSRDEARAGVRLRTVYDEVLEGWATMAAQDGAGGRPWVRDLPTEAYARHLEDLTQLQLEVIAFRDAEYAARRAADEERERALAAEYDRLSAWSGELARQHEALRAEYDHLQRWSGDLEAQLRAATGGGLRARVARLLRRR